MSDVVHGALIVVACLTALWAAVMLAIACSLVGGAGLSYVRERRRAK